jgi:16S rRNA C967 or C1407 C5-methylase (RsmB/RsmF family)
LIKRGVVLERVPFTKNGFFVISSRFNLVSCPEYLLGLFYIQDAASQIPAEILHPRETVLDAFAAPGGKATQLATYADVIAIDNNPLRMKKLFYNIQRLGINNIVAYVSNILDIKKKFDYILCDMPYSGNYMLEHDWTKKNNQERINARSKLQKQYISHELSLLNNEGVLIYSTCSLEPEENEYVINYALENHNIYLEKIDTIGDEGLTNVFGRKLDPSLKYCRRLWSSKTHTIGFFIARLRKC